ncbi:MAG TPA: hypothetical protein VG457_04170 [Planctomycetota bacterium]|jgi:DNA-binding NtrC family response regulator|nr:hypothetical protein [Planctomycetota bacterium]
MSASKVVLLVHPDSRVRILLRSILQDQGRTVMTDHSWSDLLSDRSGDVPAVILMDRSILDQEGVDALSLFRRKWNDTEVILLPEGLEMASIPRDSMIQLLRHVDRLISMKSTKELLAVSEGTG